MLIQSLDLHCCSSYMHACMQAIFSLLYNDILLDLTAINYTSSTITQYAHDTRRQRKRELKCYSLYSLYNVIACIHARIRSLT